MYELNELVCLLFVAGVIAVVLYAGIALGSIKDRRNDDEMSNMFKKTFDKNITKF